MNPSEYTPSELWLRASSNLCFVYALVGLTLYLETEKFTFWGGTVPWSLLALLLFVLGWSYSMLAWDQQNGKWQLRIFWFDLSLMVFLYLTLQHFEFAAYLASFTLAASSRFYKLRTCLWFCAGASLCYWLVFLAHGDFSLEFLVPALLIPPWYFALLSVMYNAINDLELRTQANVLNRELQAAQLQLAQNTRADERLRIARDMHDLLGHNLTAQILNLEFATHKADAAALPPVERALALSKLLLSDLRSAVSELRESPAQDFAASLADLINNVPALTVQVEQPDNLSLHKAELSTVLLRCIQEIFTNALRHSTAQHCQLKLFQADNQVVIETSNDTAARTVLKPGNGLVGIRERIEAHAGSVEWQQRGGVFSLQVHLPVASV